MSRKLQREQERENAKTRRNERTETASAATLNAPKKRKRSDVDETDPKLKEFLEVMQPASKSKSWTSETENSLAEPPTKMQAVEAPEGDSDGEYQAVPKKRLSKQSIEQTQPITDDKRTEPPAINDTIVADFNAMDATDDDWLRSRTSRLLDLVEPEDLVVAKEVSQNPYTGVMAETSENPETIDDGKEESEKAAEFEENMDATIESIQSNGRLFVRNLPYTATEEDLREHFAQYGTLEEVRVKSIFVLFCLRFVMNIQIGTAYTLKYVM